MRRILPTLVMIGLPAVAAAQSPAPGPGAFPALAPIGLPLAPIGLPLPRLGLAPVIDPPPRINSDHRLPGSKGQHPRFDSRRRVQSAPTVVYFIPAYGWRYDQPALTAKSPNASSMYREPAHLTGRLRLDVQAVGVLQLYVDGYYVGTSDDLSGELDLEVGPHAIEIRAPWYETLTFDVKIAPDRSITYQGALQPVGRTPDPDRTVRSDTPDVASEPTPAPLTTMYFIPGCYLGNVPPQEVTLPAACDLSRVIVRKP